MRKQKVKERIQLTQNKESTWHPVRTCLGCRQKKEKAEMSRIVRLPDGHLDLDYSQKQNGRGAYLCRSAGCIQKAFRSRAIPRSLKADLTEEQKDKLLKESANDR